MGGAQELLGGQSKSGHTPSPEALDTSLRLDGSWEDIRARPRPTLSTAKKAATPRANGGGPQGAGSSSHPQGPFRGAGIVSSVYYPPGTALRALIPTATSCLSPISQVRILKLRKINPPAQGYRAFERGVPMWIRHTDSSNLSPDSRGGPRQSPCPQPCSPGLACPGLRHSQPQVLQLEES